MLYNLDEICLIPSELTDVNSRSECDVYKDNKLPLYISPMTSLIDAGNIDNFELLGFNTILPRTLALDYRMEMLAQGYTVAFGLKEAEHIYNRLNVLKINNQLNYVPHICIDQANGHMSSLLNICKKFKDSLGINGVWLVVGNIANPDTYFKYAEVGVDAIRVGIGSGNVCTTSIQTGIHYPMGSLIINCYKAKQEVVKKIDEEYQLYNLISDSIQESFKYKSSPLIIADGGFKNIDQIIKALALGADYVMLGEIVAHSKEACGEVSWQLLDGIHCDARLYYGMSTEKAQTYINETSSFQNNIKHSEGICKWVPVEYSISEWKESFIHGLKSAMSYTNAIKLEDFIGKVEYNTMSQNTINQYTQNKKVYKWQ